MVWDLLTDKMRRIIVKKAMHLKIFSTTWFQLGFFLILGIILRFWGILHGYQENFLYHPDSVSTLGEVWNFFLGLNLAEKSYVGPVYTFIIIHTLGAFETFLCFLGYQVNWSLELIGITASLISALLGTATILIIFFLGNRAYNKTTGLLAAAFLSVCPLHSFHSHYPYRDIPMIFFLVITLYLCIVILEKPSLLNLTLGGFASLVTAAMKPAGIVVVGSFLVAFLIGIIRTKKFLLILGFGIVLIGIGSLALTLSPRTISFSFILAQFSESRIKFSLASLEIIKTLIQWIGLPSFIAISISIGYGLYRFRLTDIISLVFLFSAFIALATAYYIDERFMIFLLPCGYVMLGRAIMDFWKIFSKARFIKIIPFSLVGGLLLYAFLQSAWQGVLFSIPDTRFLSGRWATAHLPRETRIASAGYYPLGINEWPNVIPFDPYRPAKEDIKKAEILITSSLEYQRYFDLPGRFPNKKLFYENLDTRGFLLKKLSLNTIGFIHSTIKFYSDLKLDDISSSTLLKSFRISVPRPYDSSWNGGVSFLERGPIDRDDRTIQLGWGHRYTATVVSPKTGQEMVVFMLNGSEPSRVAVKVGWKRKIRNLTPGELHVLKFRPKWFFPRRPALYRFEAALIVGKKVSVQLRCGNREIGEAYAKWGLYDKALPYLKRALTDDPFDAESQFLLAKVEKQLGQTNQAKQTLKELTEKNPQYIQMVLSLGQPGLPADKWGQLFRDYTKLNPSLLTYALSQEFNTKKAFPSRSGEIKKDCQASGDQVIVFDRSLHKPDEVMHGPYVYLDQGTYKAGFFLRTWNVKGADPFVVIKVLADDHVISMQSISAKDLKDSDKPFKKAEIPFVNANPRAEIKFQVFATGSASFALDRIRIEPDLRKTFEEKLSQLKSISK